MYRLRLKEKPKKILSTLIILILSSLIYIITGKLGVLAQNNTYYEIICLLAWLWLIVGQIIILIKIWEE